ncbi:MAG: flagellar biosynthetic protein FliO [Bdellovibrionales bacterium]|nr:flagellar biosynthetic protein FliO [Bdellovibrionales bacterium]
MFIIALLAGGMLYFSRWYAKHNKVNTETTKIRVLGQHFLGPRKSLAIVRVAGETILIGVTDQNISMLKSLSLIDDEFPESVPNSFAKTLSATEEDADDFVISSIKDKVSAKIKNMRNI